MISLLKKGTRSILIKIIALFLAVIIPVYILGMSIYQWGYSMVEREISNSMKSQVNFYLKTLESEISRVKDLQFECINDEDLLYLVNASSIMNNFEKWQYLLRVQRRLRIVKNSSVYISGVSVHIPSLNKTISVNAGVSDLSDNWRSTLENIDLNSRTGIVYNRQTMYLNAQYPTTIRDDRRDPLFVMEISLSNERIKDRILSFSHYQGSELMMINHDTGYLLTNQLNSGHANLIFEKVKAQASAQGSTYINIEGKRYEIVFNRSEELNLQLIACVPTDEIYGSIQQYKILFILFSIVSLIVMILFAIFMRFLIHKPVIKLVRAFREMKEGHFDVHIDRSHPDEFQYLYKSFNDMAANLKDLIDQVYKQKILNQRSELKQLQSQINPHFLYNSFFIIYRMAKDEDCKNIAEFSHYLAEYYQYITRNAADDVPMKNEVMHAHNYLNIQAMRFYNRLSVEFMEFPFEYDNLIVPRLILQPIIENAFEHGLKNTSKAIIRVNFLKNGNKLIISVEDNGSEISPEDLESLQKRLDDTDNIFETTAMINIHRRIRLKFGEDSGLSMSKSNFGGLKVEITIVTGEAKDVSVIDC